MTDVPSESPPVAKEEATSFVPIFEVLRKARRAFEERHQRAGAGEHDLSEGEVFTPAPRAEAIGRPSSVPIW